MHPWTTFSDEGNLASGTLEDRPVLPDLRGPRVLLAVRAVVRALKCHAELLSEYGKEPIPYVELLATVEWHERRALILARDGFQCKKCGCADSAHALQVHHEHYIVGRLPWDYPDVLLATLCHACHHQLHQEHRIFVYEEVDGKLVRCNLVPCVRCSGTGYFPQWAHIERSLVMTLPEAIALALQCQQAGDLARAEALYRQVLSELHNRLGIVAAGQGKLDEAAASFRMLLQLRPDAPGGYTNLGNVLRLQGRLDEAVASWQQALALQPGLAPAYNNLGLGLMHLGRLAEAQDQFRRALDLAPDYAVAHSNLLLSLNYDPAADPAAVRAEHQRWALAHARGPVLPAPANERNPERCLRVGYVSPDLCQHVVARFVAPILANHDRARFEAYCYAEVRAPDAMTARLRDLAPGWRSTCGLSDAQVAAQVRADQIDLLVDLAGHTDNHRLGVFSYRPAPVQITYLGYCNTTGVPALDYLLTDAVADPPGAPAYCTEELVRLPGCFCCWLPPEAPAVAPLPAALAGHITFGSFHGLAKLNDHVLDLWSAVLRALPSARLLLFRHTLRGTVVDELRQRFAQRGIAAGRLELRHAAADGASYLDVYGEVDVQLDTLPWTGHVTTCESLWMGVPVLTLAGARHAGRLSATLLTALGLTDWIAATPEQYVDLAVRQTADLDRLAALRAGLRERMRTSPLCDGASFTRGLEDVYRALWRRWCHAS